MVQLAMDHYTQIYARPNAFQPATQAKNFGDLQVWLPHLTQDALLFTAAIALSLCLLRQVLPRQDSLKVAALEYHRRATIELRQRLFTRADWAGDGVLMAIALLMTISFLLDDKQAAESHVNGLKRLIDLRRGDRYLIGSDIYLRERILGRITAWDFIQAGHKIDPGPPVYPRHPFTPYLCRLISRLPPGLAGLALSGTINCAVIRLLADIWFCFSRLLIQIERSPTDAHKMLVFVYVLSRQVREATLNPIEQILVMVMVEVCVGFGSTRDVHCVVISYQQSRISSLSFEKSVQDVLKNSKTNRDAFIWMGAVLLATSDAASDPWRLGKQLMDEGESRIDLSETVELCERYLWYDQLTFQLSQNLN